MLKQLISAHTVKSVQPTLRRSSHKRSLVHTRKAHFKETTDADGNYTLEHPIWTQDEVKSVQITHKKPVGFAQHWAYFSVMTLRTAFDVFSGYHFGAMTESKWLIRIIFLETVAGVPGMMGAMVRHLKSLRALKRDYGWIHTLLEEAENERMHLLTALKLKRPNLFFRLCILLAQGIFVNVFFICYLVSPKFCHSFVGYLEEEAVKTYTKCVEEIETGTMQHWQTTPAPDVAAQYWRLGENATMKDVILAIRADESHHRNVNQTFSEMPLDKPNPYGKGR
eukprot:TRINITY_DN430_c0_g1_i1.p1 TRINITY_DN430_c0_g1~~TRINITY_DN430_c0_g1_i1.p1  ORF type:complete len:293 (-),score=35.73 TRINITY_DN430_c0_g1_i1:51-890(-)